MRKDLAGFLTAVYRRDLVEMRRLLVEGFDINSADEDGRTPLMHAVLAEDASVEVVEFLIDSGASVDHQDRAQRWTALHFAVQENIEDIVEALLQAGAPIEAEDAFGNSPLWRAVMSSRGAGGSIRILLSYGADRLHQNKSGVSPLDLAKRIANYDVIRFFDLPG